MLKNDIIKGNLESIDANDLRYLFYLSTYNAWVNVAGDLFKVKIKSIVETIEKEVGTTVYFDKKYHPVFAHEEQKLKILIGKSALYASVSGVSSSEYQVDATASKNSPDLSLRSIQKTFTNIRFKLGNRFLELSLELYNFDHEFANQLNTKISIEEKVTIIQEYKSRLDKAREDAIANMFWKAATSGDDEQLLSLFQEFKYFDINQSYDEHSIIEAMFDANPTVDLPFKNVMPDYNKTVELLLSHGLDKQLLAAVSQKYRSVQNNLWFFQRSNPVHSNMLSILDHVDYEREAEDEHTFELIKCSIQ